MTLYGKPKFKYGEIVRFLSNGEKLEGKIGKVDERGYGNIHDQVYYDIWVGKPGDESRAYYKHVAESIIERIKKR